MLNIIHCFIGWLRNMFHKRASIAKATTLQELHALTTVRKMAKQPLYCADCGTRLPHTNCTAINLKKRRVRFICPPCVQRLGQRGISC